MTDDSEIDGLVRRLRAGRPEMSEPAFTEGRARLLAAVDRAPGSLPEPPLAARRAARPTARRLLPLAAAVAIAILGGGVVVVSVTGEEIPVAPPAGPEQPAGPWYERPLPAIPAEPRNDAGRLGENATDLVVAPGEYLYIERRPRGRDTAEPARTWIPADRSGTWQRTTEDGTMFGDGGRFDTKVVGWWHPDAGFTAALPRDPRALYRQLVADQWPREDAPAAAFRKIAQLLADAVPADLRRALFGTLGYLPGVAVGAETTTGDGRTAVPISIDDQGFHRIVLLVDPATGLLVGGHQVQLVDAPSGREGGLVPAGTIVGEWTADYAVVGRMGDKP
ncbi:hypothetical protein [Qaidamihabitans albus]|uniref:hypothetical protein n=1 Tax=Qaidamihabitans albus TaxID=2795733 RepID=UPI0018F242CB|nr:hypothetical protein [Qaidamihabitans albus]